MKNALDLNQVATLSTVLISNLDENVFFSNDRLSNLSFNSQYNSKIQHLKTSENIRNPRHSC